MSVDVERLFLRLVSIEDVPSLQVFVTNHLPTVLVALDGNGSDRQTAVELLKHLNVRLKTNDSVHPSVSKLVDLYRDVPTTAFSSNFFVVYLKMCFERIDLTEQQIVLPRLLHALLDKDVSQQNRAFGFLMPVLASFALVADDSGPLMKLRRMLAENETLRLNLVSFVADLILLPSVTACGDGDSSNENVQRRPAMSACGYDRVKQHEENSQLDELKPGLLKSLPRFGMNPSDLFAPILAGLMSTIHSLLSAAELEWKHLDWKDLIEERKLVAHMYILYLGNLADSKVAESLRVQPANPQQQLKLLPLIVRSATAAATFPSNIQLICDGLFGEQRPGRLRTMCAEFLSKIVPHIPKKLLPTFGPIVYSTAKKVVTDAPDASGTDRMVVFALSTLGQIGLRCPFLLAKDVQFIQSIFDIAGLQGDDDGVRSAAADCLSSWTAAFRDHFDSQSKHFLKALVETYVSHTSPRCRLIAIKLISALFERCAPSTLWLLFISSADSRDDVKSEAEHVLNECLDASDVPSFTAMVDYLSSKVSASENRSADILSTALLFCRALLLMEIKDQLPSQLEMSSFREVDVAFSPYVHRRLTTLAAVSSVDAYMRLACNLSQQAPDVIVLKILREVSTSVPISTRKMYLDTDWLKALCWRSSNQQACRLANELYCTTLVDDESACETALRTAIHDFTLTPTPSVSTVWLLGSLLATVGNTGSSITAEEARMQLFSLLSVADGAVNVSVLEAATAATAAVVGYSSSILTDRRTLIDRLTKIAHSKKDYVKTTTRESAIAALGSLVCGGSETNETYDAVVDALMKLGEGPPQPELQFAVGDALAAAALAEQSPTRRNQWTETVDDFISRTAAAESNDRLGLLTDLLINDKLHSQNHHVRKSTVTWLYSFVKLCGTWHKAIADRLEAVQGAFIEGLTSDSEFTQDIASRGLELVSEIGTKEHRERMLSVLVETLTTGKRTARKQPLGPDDKVFEKGAIGSAPGGGSLSTYKELCSMASDLNKPDLLYKFMQLANHQALWNSKKGAAMGFGSILAKTSEDLEPYLPLLVPKLYRFRYDPDGKIRATMSSIWSMLASKRKGLTDAYAEVILNELMKSITDAQWRTRESTCLALSDLLSGHAATGMFGRFSELWSNLFLVQDDIKESVRVAANRCISTLSTVTVRFCTESARTSVVEKHLGDVLECLLVKGMQSKVKETKAASLRTVVDLSKRASVVASSSALFKPHLSLIVRRLLEALSETESALWNYVAVRANADEMERVDDVRTSVARSSSLMDSLSNCAIWVDNATTLADLCPTLTELLSSTSGGLSTRVGVCSFVSLLCTRCQYQLRTATAVADRLLKGLTAAARDRNMTLKKASASTIGHLIPYVSDKAVGKLIDTIRELNAPKEEGKDGSEEATCAFVLRSIALYNPESLKDFAADVVPLILFAMNKEPPVPEGKESSIYKIWQEIWLEVVPGKEGGMRLYKKEIVQFAQTTLKELSVWSQKAAVFRLLADFTATLTTQLDSVDIGVIHELAFSSLGGRYWDGKIEVLNCLIGLFEGRKELLDSIPLEALSATCARLRQEAAKKKNVDYQCRAITALGVFVKCAHIQNRPCLDQLIALAQSNAKLGVKNSVSSDEEGDASERAEAKIQIVIAAMDSCARVGATSPDACDQQLAFTNIVEIGVSNSFWKIKRCCLLSVDLLLSESCNKVENVCAAKLFELILDCVGDTAHTSLVDAAIALLSSLCELVSVKKTLTFGDVSQYSKPIGRLIALPQCRHLKLQELLSSPTEQQ